MRHQLHRYFHKRLNHLWVKPVGYDTGIKIYNCVAKEKVPLVVRNKDCSSWYTCGPTVYDSSHIGHASCYVKLDILQRLLRDYFKINLVTVMNITDIDDKIINKSIQTKTPISEITQHYEKEFWEDVESLDLMKPDLVLRVTEHIPMIEDFVLELLNKGAAFKDEDGSIVFNIKEYGKLQNVSKANTGPAYPNFTLWKASKDNETNWNIKYPNGRPGWHTECSALASSVFGSTLDFHAGGDDLRFPHHENEEAQCCAYFSKSQWVNYWVHTGHLMQKSTKMSKSLQNTMSIRTMLKSCDSNTFRMMCLMSHYRKNMEFTPEFVNSGEKHLENYRNFLTYCKSVIDGKLNICINGDVLTKLLINSKEEIHKALCDDFDTAYCVKVLNNLINVTYKMINASRENLNRDLQGMLSLINVTNFVKHTVSVFGFDLDQTSVVKEESKDFDQLINILTEFRQNIRLAGLEKKNENLLQLCDGVRNNLNRIGIIVKDHKDKSIWYK
ncbi:hypothetical protein RN001_006784 [Aquatica leii]|uniref:cysteine--tRNA ligase n=1 Tax=Aquatica leii TaxID=1421715 RepID=A0AAN7P8N1_9COLE|nr:hypothetical protein RN001_006784 [Aquatica leii]